SLDIIDVASLHLNSADILVGFLAVGWLMSFALRPTLIHSSPAPTRTDLPHHKPIPESPRDREASNVPAYLIFAILALLATMLLSITAAINISSSLKEISKWLEFLMLILIGTQYLRTRRQIWTIIILVCLAGITQAFYG